MLDNKPDIQIKINDEEYVDIGNFGYVNIWDFLPKRTEEIKNVKKHFLMKTHYAVPGLLERYLIL